MRIEALGQHATERLARLTGRRFSDSLSRAPVGRAQSVSSPAPVPTFAVDFRLRNNSRRRLSADAKTARRPTASQAGVGHLP
jgi:hypothetical protein